MAQSRLLDDRQRYACEEIAASPGSVIATSLRFMPPASGERVLAMEALLQSLQRIPALSSEPAVAVAQLGWWQSELSEEKYESSQHPIVQALKVTGVLDNAAREACSAYIAMLAGQVDAPRPGSGAELREALTYRAGLELALLNCGHAVPDTNALLLRARGIYLQQACGLFRAGGNSDWIPSRWMARFGLKPEFDGATLPAEQAGSLSQHFSSVAQEWINETGESGVPGASENETDRYLLIRSTLDQRWLQRMQSQPSWLHDTGGGRVGLSDMLHSWRASRKGSPGSSRKA